MKKTRFLISGLMGLLLWTSSLQAQEALRPEIGKPLQAAQELIKAHKYKEALAKIRDADAVSGKSAHEVQTLERLRFVAASNAGNTDDAAKALETLITAGKLPVSDQQKFIQAVAVAYYRDKDYGKTISWLRRYFKEGGSDGQMRTLLVQSYYLSGDHANVVKQLAVDIAAEEKAGGKPDEEQLQMLGYSYNQIKDMDGYLRVLEKLVAYYPKPERWADLLARLQRKSGFAERLTLDVYRLKQANGNIGGAGDTMEMAQLALQAGYPAEAKKIVDEGYAKNLLGSGPPAEVDRHKRLRDLVARQLAEDKKNLARDEAQANTAKEGVALVNVGYNLVLNGQADKGLALMEKGMAKGNLKRPEDAKLHLAQAYLLAGQNAKAEQVFKTVQGVDGTADLAHLWLLKLSR